MWKGTTETQPIDHVATGHRRSQTTRRTICFPFPNLLWPRWLGVADAAQERGVNLICLAQANTSAPPVTESQANVLYDLVKTGRVVESLYFREAHLGFASCEVGPRDGLVYEALRRQLGSALWGTLLLQKHERTEEAL